MSEEALRDTGQVPIEESIRALFVRMVEPLDPKYFALEVRPEGRGVTIFLKSTSVANAPIAAHVDTLEVVLTCGHGTVFEIPAGGRRYTNLPLLEEVQVIATAVIEGRFEETVWFRRGRPVKARGSVRVNGRAVRTHWSAMFSALWGRTEKRQLSYQPYPRLRPADPRLEAISR